MTNDRKEELLKAMKNLFIVSTGNSSSSLSTIPSMLKNKQNAVTQVARWWIPAIEAYFGSFENFLNLVVKTEQGFQQMEKLISSGAADECLREHIEPMINEAVKHYQHQTQQVIIFSFVR